MQISKTMQQEMCLRQKNMLMPFYRHFPMNHIIVNFQQIAAFNQR